MFVSHEVPLATPASMMNVNLWHAETALTFPRNPVSHLTEHAVGLSNAILGRPSSGAKASDKRRFSGNLQEGGTHCNMYLLWDSAAAITEKFPTGLLGPSNMKKLAKFGSATVR